MSERDDGSPEPPEVLGGGRYRVTSRLGAGSQGETFAAVDARTGARVAVKRFRVRGARSWKDVELAEREARVLSGLSHPNVPRYVDHFEEDGALCLVTELVEGETLAQLAARGATLDEGDVVRLLRDVGDALAYLHTRAPPVVHRDIKPGNVVRRPDGSFALIDFGAVRDRMKPDGGSTVVGTFGYMAPESFQGRATPQSDVYALGATVLRMLTGIEPEAMPHRGLAIDVASLLRGRVSGAMVSALASMVEPDPDRRPARVQAVLDGVAGDARRRGDERERERERAPRRDAREEHAWARARGPSDAAAADDVARGGNRKDRRRAKRDERRRRRERAPRGAVDIGPGGRALANVGLAIAYVAVRIAVGAVVPALLAVLAAVFGPALTRAAARVHEASHRACAAISRARVRVGLEPMGPTEIASEAGGGERVRVDASEREHERVRVESGRAREERGEREEREEREREEREREARRRRR